MRGSGKGRVIAAWLGGLVAAAQAVEVAAHTQAFPIEGESLQIDTRGAPNRAKFLFRARRQFLISPVHDPSVYGSSLLVVGNGPNGGRTSLIELDPAGWRGLGSPPGTGGYQYKDSSGSAGGVRKIVYKPGSLVISAKGEAWPWELGGRQDSIDVYFSVENEAYCARFGGLVTANDEEGRFIAKASAAPLDCPTSLCGNGRIESGEECDDGNVSVQDACGNDCRISVCPEGAEDESTWAAL